MIKTIVFLSCVASAAAATAADKAALTAANNAVASSDVCKDDEWSYLCNTDAWAGAADAVTGGQELQTAALRRALDHTIAHTACAAGDTSCKSTKDIVDAQLLNIPKVINSNSLAQVNDAAGLIHPAAAYLTFTAGGLKTTTALYSGATIGMTLATDGGAFIDQASLMKWVDASVKNGCDDADGAANTAAERLAGSKDVRGTAHALITNLGTCTVIATAARTTQAFSGQGRKACQTAGGTYVNPTSFSVGFAYADLTSNTMGVAAGAKAPTTAWRLCMTSPSVGDNTIFADTTLTVTAKCPAGKTFVGMNCVCEAGRTLTRKGVATDTADLKNADGTANTECLACITGKTSTPNADNTHRCTACPAGKMSSAGATTNKNTIALLKQGAAGANSGMCANDCPVGTHGIEHIVFGSFANTEADFCAVCPTGTFNPTAGQPHKSDCNGCGAGAFNKFGLTQGVAAAHDAWTDVCEWECGQVLLASADALLGSATADDAGANTGNDLANACTLKTNEAITAAQITAANGVAGATSAGTGLALKYSSSTAAVTSITVTNAGSGYKVGNTLTIAGIAGRAHPLILTLVADDFIAGYGLRVNNGIWSNTAKGTSAKDWSGVSAGLTEDTADFGTYAAKTGQFNQCVLAATCKAKKLLADPMTKTCVATCPSGLKADGLSQFCVLAKCAANERSVSTVVSAEVKNTGAEDAAQFVPAKVTFTCEKCKAGKTADAAYNYHSDAVGTIAFAVNLMNTQDDAILKGLPSSTVVKNVFAAARYTSTNCLEAFCVKDFYVNDHACKACALGEYRNNHATEPTLRCQTADPTANILAKQVAFEGAAADPNAACWKTTAATSLSGAVCDADGATACNTEVLCLGARSTTTGINRGFVWKARTVAEKRAIEFAAYTKQRDQCDNTAAADTVCAPRDCGANTFMKYTRTPTNALSDGIMHDITAKTCTACPTGKYRKGAAAKTNGAEENGFDGSVCVDMECAVNEYAVGDCYKKADNTDHAALTTKATCDGGHACLFKDTHAASGNKCLLAGSTDGLFDDACADKAACATNQALYWGSTYFWGGKCTACAAGTEAPGAADDAFDDGKPSACVDTICPINTYVLDKACKACPTGKRATLTTDLGGTLIKCWNVATGGVSGNVCETGADGLKNDACATQALCLAETGLRWGSSANQGPTPVCAFEACAENKEFNAASVCTACAGGKTLPGVACTKADGSLAGATCEAGADGQKDDACNTRALCLAETGYVWGTAMDGVGAPCTAVLCAKNQQVAVAPSANKYFAADVCAACPAGKSSATGKAGVAGGDASVGTLSAQCLKWTCPINFYRHQHVCVACPAGKSRAAGDDSSVASSTSCTTTNCGAEALNKAVTNGVCVACAAGTSVVNTASTQNAWVAAPTAGACANTADTTTVYIGNNCGIEKTKPCNNEANCKMTNFGAGTVGVWQAGSCVLKLTGVAIATASCNGGKTCVSKTNCDAQANTDWISDAAALGSDADVAAADKSCAPLSCLAGTAANGNTQGFGSFAAGNSCTKCAAGKRLMVSSTAPHHGVTVDSSAGKVTTGKFLMPTSGVLVGVVQKTGILIHGVFKANTVDYLGETHYLAANCAATTCGAQEQVVNHECKACAAGKWNANGAAKFTTAAVNAPCVQMETCTLHQFVASNGRCENKDGTAQSGGTFTTLATCIAGDATNTWRVCTHCASKCYARGQYKSFADGTHISGSNCGAAKNAACSVKANCLHAVTSGTFFTPFRHLATVKTSMDASEGTATSPSSGVCLTGCAAGTSLTGTTVALGGKCFAKNDNLYSSYVADATEGDACKVDAAKLWFPICTACTMGKTRVADANAWKIAALTTYKDGTTTCVDHKCPPGYAVTGSGTNKVGACHKCPTGTQAVGANRQAGGATLANSAVVSTLTADGLQDETCTGVLCAKDFFSDWSTVTAKKCTACAAGKSIMYAGLDGKGTTGLAGDVSFSATTCHDTACNAGYFVSTKKCVKCAAGTTRAGGDLVTGSDTVCTAETCTLAEYVTAANACAACPAWETANTVAQAKTTPSSGTAMCTEVKCPVNEYVVVTGDCGTTAGGNEKNTLFNCGADNQSPCTTKANCEASADVKGFWTKKTAVCKACAVGTSHAADTSLSAAQASTVCTNDAATGETYTAVCAVDQFVKNHVCTACATGKSRAAGDDPNSNIDTACANSVTPVAHGALCAVDEYVHNFACVQCAAGTTNNAGDDPHHYDTVCQATKCKANEYVKEHVCTACEAVGVSLLTNTAGDDASGADTKCYVV